MAMIKSLAQKLRLLGEIIKVPILGWILAQALGLRVGANIALADNQLTIQQIIFCTVTYCLQGFENGN